MHRHGPLLIVACLVALAAARPADAGLADEEPFAKLSPFSGLRWEAGAPQVRVDDVWYALEAIDGVRAADIVAYCDRTYGSRARKRFGEDLVEVMTGMGHAPGATVTLRLRDLDGGDPFDRTDVRMTEANRRAVWAAGRGVAARRRPDPKPAPIEREHAVHPDARFAELAGRPNAGAAHPARRLTAEQAAADLDELERHLNDRFSYLTLRDVDLPAALDTIRIQLAGGIRVDDFAIQLQQLMTLFGDGHAGVRDLERALGPGYAPCLFGDTGDRIVAFAPDRSGFIVDGLPYVVGFDRVPLQPWLAAAASIVPAGAPQLVRERSTRTLRYAPFLARRAGLEVPRTITVESSDGARTAIAPFDIQGAKPIYGPWPRTDSRVIDDRIGYLRIPRMDDTAAAHVHRVMAEVAGTDGLIVDLRGNGGGTREPILALLPYLMPPDAPPVVVNVAAYRLSPAFDPDHLEARFMYRADDRRWSPEEAAAIAEVATRFEPEWTPPEDRFSPWHYMVVGRTDAHGALHYERPVVVLMDGGCFSATDIMLGALDLVPQVTLLGTASSGGSGRSTTITLAESGLRVRMSSMASFRPDGRLYDGRGIEPDVEVRPQPGYFIGRGDAQLDAAIERLREPFSR